MRPQKNPTIHILSSKFFIFILLIILVFIVFNIFKNSSQQKNITSQKTDLNQQIEKIEQQNIELAELLDYFSSPEYVEKEAREKLNLAKPDEKVIIVSENPENNSKILSSNDSYKNKLLPSLWWSYFFE